MAKDNSPITVHVPDEAELGPAMQKLNERQQKFVMAMIQLGGANHTRAAISAGYDYNPENRNVVEVTAHRLAHSPRIQEAIKEVGLKMLNAGSLMAVKTVLDIVDNPQLEPKDRLKAAEMIMNRSGLHALSEHKVAVTHTDKTGDEMIKRIKQLSKKFGIDSQKLLGGMVVEAEFTEVAPEDDISDLL